LLRFSRTLKIGIPLLVVAALTAVGVGAARTTTEPVPRMAPAPIDTRVPKTLETATFGMG
jgi:hypothetical protein